MRRRSSNSARVKFLKIDYDEIISYLKRYASKLVDLGDAELIILFGSLARGDYTGTSDADVLIISSKAGGRFIDRPLKFMDPGAPITIEPRVLTPEEAAQMAARGERFMREALKEGVILAGDKSLYQKLVEILKPRMNHR